MEKIAARMESLPTTQIKEIIQLLANKFGDAEDAVTNAAIKVLEIRVPGSEFVEFLNALYA